MRKFRSYKVVEAMRIGGYETAPGGLRLHDFDEKLEPVYVNSEWQARHKPEDGLSWEDGYLVVYADGYKSWSPAEAFESGYIELVDNETAGAERMLRWFDYKHLPPLLAAQSQPFAKLANQIAREVQPGPERTVALRKLLEAKDAAVRAVVQPGG